MIRSIYIFLFIFLVQISFSQENYLFEKITTEDGLSSNTVISIAQDKEGRMWFGTYDGLNVFDGARIITYRHSETDPLNSLSDNRIDYLYTDRTGTLWIQQPNGHISRLSDPVKGIFRNYLLKLPNNEILTLAGNANGKLIIICKKGKFIYKSESDTFIFAPSLNNNTEPTIVHNFKKKHPGISIQQYWEQNNDNFFLATLRNGVVHLSGNNQRTLKEDFIVNKPGQHFSLSNNEVYSVFVDRYGVLWVGTKDGGVNKRLTQASFIQTLYHTEGEKNTLPLSTIRAISQDTKGNIWIGTYTEGVAIYSIKTGEYTFFNHHNKPGMANWDRIRSLYKTSDNAMWIGSYEGICRIDPKNGDKQYFPADTSKKAKISERIYSMAEDSKGYLWIGTWGGVYRIQLTSFKIEHILDRRKLSDAHIRKLLFDKRGNLWIGTEFGGINLYNPTTGKITVMANIHKKSNSLSNNSIFSILECRSGEIWIGTFDGLNIYNPQTQKYRHYTIDDGLPSNLVLGIIEDHKGNFWVSTSKGVVKFDSETHVTRSFDHADGWINTEFTEGAYFINPTGELFFGGNSGVTFFDPEKITRNLISPDVIAELTGVHKLAKSVQNGTKGPILIKYFDRNASFRIHAFHYLDPQKNSIAWRLLPIETEWNNKKGASADVVYNQLPPGNYKLEFKAANADGVWGNIKSYPLRIDSPFWLKTWFLILLAISLFACILVIGRIKLHQERNRSKTLESLIRERTFQIELQKEQLETKNIELERFNQDIRRQKDQILQQHDNLLELHERLKDTEERKMQFFTNISHEIRTPLTLISGPIEQLIEENTLNPLHTEKLHVVRKQTGYLLGLINQLLDYKKLESGNMTFEPQPGELVLFCNEIIQSFRYEMHLRDITLSFESKFPALNVFFDPDKLRQILINLLSNALKFTQNQGWVKFTLSLNANHSKIRIDIADNGIGIPADRLDRIFERFYQVGNRINPSFPGTGIGLSLAKDLAKLQKGDICVESEEGQGSHFTLSLPYLPVETNRVLHLPETEYTTLNQSMANTETNPKTIDFKQNCPLVLVVDDHPDMVQFIRDILKEQYNVIDARNGREALQQLKHHRVDVIVSDWLMPEMDGLTFCEKTKQNKKYCPIPFIMVTALSENKDQLKALKTGADDFISKPFSGQLLVTKINNLLTHEKNITEANNLNQRLEPQNIKIETSDEKWIDKIVKIIEENLENPKFNPDSLGMILGWSKMQLYRRTKQFTGVAPNELIQSLRLKRGKQLLDNTGFTISEVSFKVGFNDPKYFSRSFFKAFDIQPSQYQELKKTEKMQKQC